MIWTTRAELESIVVSITGNGLKTLEVVADELPYPVVIDPKLADFDRLLEQQGSATNPSGLPPTKAPALAGATL